ncbi:MAG: hypothetical protein ACOVQ4_11930 [Flectobacillus sp.]|uniref:hypothetical protein n=1 Tax=Flectobacillus sp. TaxID=50419 RepID=UPI003B99DB3E
MKKRTFGIGLLALMIGLQSCDFSKRIDTTAAVKELKERQVKRINSAQITAQVDDWGKKITQDLNKSFVKNILDAHAIDSLQKTYRIEIAIGSPIKLQNPALGKKVNEILDAYQYNAENHLPQIDNIQMSEDREHLYFTSPVVLENQLKGASKAQLQELVTKTKIDSLDFRKKGDLLGLWMIKFSKKDVIRLVDVKQLSKLNTKIEQ